MEIIMIDNKAMNFLLVEDDQVDVKTLKRAFAKCNVNNPLYIAGNGEEALKMLRGNGDPPIVPPPHVILLDLNMPKMNGIEFLKELRKDPDLKAISVFVLTTSDEDRDKIAAYDLNVSGYILKPIKFDQFLEAVKILDGYWTLNQYPDWKKNA